MWNFAKTGVAQEGVAEERGLDSPMAPLGDWGL